MSSPAPERRESFARLAQTPDAEIDLAQAALLIAAEEYPALEVSAYVERLDALASAAGPALRAAGGAAEQAARLVEFLFSELGFCGNSEHYDDPRNSFLNEVLERRTGIPITLSLVYIEVGRRLGLPVRGVGFPGHFLARVESAPEVLVDAFHGRLISEPECAELLRTALGSDAVLDPEVHLRAATPREILVRVLTNLKHTYARSRDFERMLGCCDRILLLRPGAPEELRDRGLVYEQLECFAAAVADLRAFLELAPEHPMLDAVRERLQALEQRSRLH